ncbi:MAG: AMP-binding protein [Deltaproteobacteria bacterium]|nr:AMP-binding protein [Deltaproteobacteria bacterium]
MTLAVHARENPERPAIVSSHGTRTFDALNRRANRLARALRARGLREDDGVALLCGNRPEFAEVHQATQRCGLRITPINWHLTGDEVGYVVSNSEARAFFADARFPETAIAAARQAPQATTLVSLGGEIEGFVRDDDFVRDLEEDDVEDPCRGTQMLYTSGTTGRPKGVYRRQTSLQALGEVGKRIAYRAGDVHLCTGPLYHAAPLAFSLTIPLLYGATVALMSRWNAEEALREIERHRVTHTHMVPTMFHRLLALPEETRRRSDVSSLRVVLHGAAPCPVHLKQSLIDWLGPVVYEYYAATEGWGSFVTPEEWLAHPGTVGKPNPDQVEIRDDAGAAVPPRTTGRVFLKAPDDETRFSYFSDDAKTRGAYDATGGYFTLGDVGYVDEDGYLYLCDRSADVIISGGVNVYPAEVDAVLLTHPAVRDVCCIGVPDEEWGESVRAVVELTDGQRPSPELAAELLEHARARLAHFKCPRAVDFAESLPRLDSGKIQRRTVREPYWSGRERRI